MNDRLQEMPTELSAQFVEDVKLDPSKLLGPLGLTDVQTDLTDGARLICEGAVVHLRPSANAPELRLYVEASTKARCNELLALGLKHLKVLSTA